MIQPSSWPLAKRVAFRFVFLYFCLYLLSFPVSQFVPLLGFIDKLISPAVNFMVESFNRAAGLFDTALVPLNGSGDTSWGWAFLAMSVALSAVGTLIWSLVARSRKSHPKLEYILWNAMRYFVAFFSFSYGTVKVLALQMPFPNLSQLATPLGDFLPMRLSWLFLGYSTPYEVFGGIMEITVGLLLLYRRTVTLGLFIGAGVFLNVVMLNYCYDVPVKLFSTHLALMCLWLLADDFHRLTAFFLFNRPVASCIKHYFSSERKWMRHTRIVLKILFVIVASMDFFGVCEWYIEERYAPKPFAYGFYDVENFIRNRDTVPLVANDTLAWKDMIFDVHDVISVNTTDTLLRQAYRRGYMVYKRDSIANTLDCYCWKGKDSVHVANFTYALTPDGMLLKGKIKSDSVKIDLKKSKRHFQLAEKQFHWLSEANR